MTSSDGSFYLPACVYVCVIYMCIYREQCLSYFTFEGWNNLSGTVFPRVLYLFIFFLCLYFWIILCFVCLCVVLQLKFLYHVLNLVISSICQAHTTGVSSRFKPDWFLPTLGGAIWCGCLIKDYLAFRVQHLDGYVSVFQEGTTVPVKKDIQGEANGAAEQLWTS